MQKETRLSFTKSATRAERKGSPRLQDLNESLHILAFADQMSLLPCCTQWQKWLKQRLNNIGRNEGKWCHLLDVNRRAKTTTYVILYQILFSVPDDVSECCWKEGAHGCPNKMWMIWRLIVYLCHMYSCDDDYNDVRRGFARTGIGGRDRHRRLRKTMKR